MIKAIIFDFDGVIVESAEIKTDAFGELFSDYPQHAHKLVEYHKKNMGISRYIKFRYFYENILKTTYSDEMDDILGEKFSEIALDKVLNAPFVNGAEEFIKDNQNKYLMFIASGTPHDEMIHIVKERKIFEYFKEIHGSPKSKTRIIEEILYKYNLKNYEVVFVGDAETDRTAAQEKKLHFIARMTETNGELLKDCNYKIKDINELERSIDNLKAF